MQHAGSDLKAHIRAAQLIAPRQVDELELFTEGIGYAVTLFSSGLWKVKDVKARESLFDAAPDSPGLRRLPKAQ